MANNNPVNSWDSLVLAASETTFNTIVTPASAQALEVISCDLGHAANVGQVRPKKDRPQGRGMQSGWVEGDVEPIPFSIEYSQKSRAAVDTAAKDLAILKAAGMTQTITGGVSTALTVGPTPIETGSFSPLQLMRYLGKGDALHEMEMSSGGVVKQISWSGGEKEITVKASGDAASKTWAGRIDSFTLASGVVTTYTPSVSDVRKFGGANAIYAQCESEIMTLGVISPSIPSFDSTESRFAGVQRCRAHGHAAHAVHAHHLCVHRVANLGGCRECDFGQHFAYAYHRLDGGFHHGHGSSACGDVEQISPGCQVGAQRYENQNEDGSQRRPR